MIHPILLVGLLTGICASTPAQTIRDTLPAGLVNRGGDWNDGKGSSHVLGGSRIRYQEVHSSWTGQGAKVLSGVAFRRAWNQPYSAGAVGRSFDVTFTVGLGNVYRFDKTSFAGNYKSPPTVAHPKRTVRFPSWVHQPTASPAPFDAVLPFASLVIYFGTDDLVWEIDLDNGSGGGVGYHSDRQQAFYGHVGSTTFGRGCVATGRTQPHTHIAGTTNSGPGNPLRMQMSVMHNPDTPVTLAMGVKMTSIRVPGWCAPVLTQPLVYRPLGKPMASNYVVRHVIDFPYSAGLVGVPFYSQAFAPDSGPAGLSLSNACRNVVPPPPIPQSWKYVFGTAPNAIEGPYTVASVVTGWY